MEDGVRWFGVADDGATLEIVLQPASDDTLTQRWPPIGLVRSDEPGGPVVRHVLATVSEPGDQPVVQVDGEDSWGGWDRVESELALFAAERLANLVAVHAGLVRWGDAALIVPGPSHAGKSSLCVAAVAAGAAILTDEYALVDPASGLVSGWPRPVRIRRSDGEIDRVDLAVASEPIRVGLVALLTFEPGSDGEWGPVSASDAVLGLLANTVCARSRPHEALDAACAVARTSVAVAGTRGEADLAVEELLSRMDAAAP